jgi:hypothetical protein
VFASRKDDRYVTQFAELGADVVAGSDRYGLGAGAGHDDVTGVERDLERRQLVGEPSDCGRGVTHHVRPRAARYDPAVLHEVDAYRIEVERVR